MVKFKFADIGEGLTEGKVANIMIKVGDKIKDGDEMFSVETDKVNTEIYSPCDGFISKINMKVGDIIYVGDIVIEINDEKNIEENINPSVTKQSIKLTNNNDKSEGVIGSVPVSDTILSSRNLLKNDDIIINNNILSTPIVRKMASDLNIDLIDIKGTGINGKILKDDLIEFNIKNIKKETKYTSDLLNNNLTKVSLDKISQININNLIHREKMSKIRKIITKKMILSKNNVTSVTLMKNIDVTKLVEFKKQLKEQIKKYEINITYMPFFIKACVIALKEFPIFNSSYDQERQEIIFKNYYNIGIAIDTPNGLMVPVIKDVDKLNIKQITKNINDLILNTREYKLKSYEMKDGTFTITNFGSFGVDFATPIINFPEVAILGVGIIKKTPVVNNNNEIVISYILPLSLTIDHRLIDGADAGRFIIRITELLELPILLLL